MKIGEEREKRVIKYVRKSITETEGRIGKWGKPNIDKSTCKKKKKALKIFMCIGCHNKIASIREDEDLKK